ncbi:MAG: methylaspartate mutase, partial [Planctomycetota bacterium]
AVGAIMQEIARIEGINLVGVDIGGATTDIFYVWHHHDEKADETREVFNRTVSANLGMSYSVSNVLAEAGLENVMRWVPFNVDERKLRNRIKNKMIRPTTIPQSLEDLIIEQAIAREALRLAFIQHKDFAQELKGVSKAVDISQAFRQTTDKSIVKMPELDMLVGSGGVLSHAPRRNQAALMLIDGFLPEGITRLAVDSIFMMPQLGVLANIQKPELEATAKKAAVEVFNKDCLIKLGTCIANRTVPKKPRGKVMTITFTMPDGKTLEKAYGRDDMELIPLGLNEKARVRVVPERGIDVGSGPGRVWEGEVEGGVVGVIVDARGRRYKTGLDATGKQYQEASVPLPEDRNERVQALKRWHSVLGIYPDYDL